MVEISGVEEAGRTGTSLVIKSGATDKSLRSEDDFLKHEKKALAKFALPALVACFHKVPHLLDVESA